MYSPCGEPTLKSKPFKTASTDRPRAFKREQYIVILSISSVIMLYLNMVQRRCTVVIEKNISF